MKTINRQKGFTLIELMIALVIGSIIMIGVGTIYSATKRSYKTQEEFSRLQENGRFALNYIARFVRGAGYSGCSSGLSDFYNDLNDDDKSYWKFQTGIEGYEAVDTNPGDTVASALAEYPDVATDGTQWVTGGGATNTDLPAEMLGATDAPVAHTDVLVSRTADGAGVEIKKNNSGSQIFLSCEGSDPDGCGEGEASYSGLCEGDVLVVSDCKKAIAFQANNITQTGSGNNCSVNVTHDGRADVPGNKSSSWGGANPPPEKSFTKGDETLKVSTKVFYVGKGLNGPALFMKIGNQPGQELVEGVETFQVLYGEDLDGTPDNVPNAYVSADKVVDWGNVVAVKISVLLRSIKELPHRDSAAKNLLVGGPTIRTGGTMFTSPTDKRMRRVMSMTIKLRNRAFSL